MFLLLTVYFTRLVVAIATTCEPNYFIPEGIVTRFQAYQLCKMEGAELASIENEEQYRELLRHLHKIGEEDLYYWVDGLSYWTADDSKWWFDSTGKEANYSAWCAEIGQPQELAGTNSYGEPCVAMNYRGDSACWHDYPCYSLFPFICYKGCTTPTPDVPFGEFCVFYDPQTAEGAARECEMKSKDQALLVMNDPDKYTRLLFHLKVYGRPGLHFWTSLQRQANLITNWVWNSGRGPREEWTYWDVGQPNNVEHKCGLVSLSKTALRFNDQSCNSKQYYICE